MGRATPAGRLAGWCGEAGIEISSQQANRLAALAELVTEWGPGLGLTAIHRPDDVLLKHVADSLLLATVIGQPQSLVDIGCGVGLPGVALAILWPEARVWLVDSRARAAGCALHLAGELRLANVRVCHGRAEEEETSACVGKVDVVVTRGFSPARGLVRAAMPYIGERTILAVYSGPAGVSGSIREGLRAAGLARQVMAEARLPSAGWARWFWLASARDFDAVSNRSRGDCFT